MVTLQFSTSTAFTSEIIRRLCHSPFSHCDIVVEGEGLLGVSGPDKSISDPGGVLLRKFNCWPYLHTPKLAHLHARSNVTARVVEIGRSQIDKPFDDGAMWSLLSDKPGDRNWRSLDKWFCSEFVAYCLEEAGFFPYPLISAKNRITPADLLLLVNPFMSADNIKEFTL